MKNRVSGLFYIHIFNIWRCLLTLCVCVCVFVLAILTLNYGRTAFFTDVHSRDFSSSHEEQLGHFWFSQLKSHLAKVIPVKTIFSPTVSFSRA